MLHTKVLGNWSTGSGEEDILKGFYHIRAWQPSWSCDLYHVKKIISLYLKHVHIKFGLR